MGNVISGITKQRSTATSCHEVDRQTWLDWHLAKNHNKLRELSGEFKSAAGDGYKPITPEDVQPILDNT